MAQTVQIVPKYLFPHVEAIINNNTIQNDDATQSGDNTVKLLYVVTAPSGKDNYFVKFTDRSTAEALMGKSDFKTYGQPYMQALECLDHTNTSVWIMRVMPENATYSNAIISAYFKADDEETYAEPHKRKFRIKFTSKNAENIVTAKDLANAAATPDGIAPSGVYVDGEGYSQKEIMTFNASGRGVSGDLLSVRLSQNYEYEKEFGIKMYNYEVLDFTSGLTLLATYVGANVTSANYIDSNTPTLINDVIDGYAKGQYPVDIVVNEDNILDIYDAYIKFLKKLHVDLEEEYAEKVSEFNISEDVMNGTTQPTEEESLQIKELAEIAELIDATDDENLPKSDEFDLIFGRKVGEKDIMLPAIFYPEKLTDDVDITEEDYDANDYTTTDIVDLSDTKGVAMTFGSDGYFAEPRTEVVDGVTKTWTKENEVNYCFKKALSGSYDKRILSKLRIPVSAFFDANYDFEVKEVLYDLVKARDSARLYLDAGIISAYSNSSLSVLEKKYEKFDHMICSIDTQNYWVKESSTLKKVNVTVTYLMAPAFCDHINNNGTHIPFVKDYCVLTGHIRDSLTPTVDDFEMDLSERLYIHRFNYFESIGENQFRRATQSTRDIYESDLLEENNVLTLYEIKNELEKDASNELYNFADETVREDFCTVENAKFKALEGSKVQSIDITFRTSEYEHNHSILHLYLTIIFRGLNKRILVEININKRAYVSKSDEEE